MNVNRGFGPRGTVKSDNLGHAFIAKTTKRSCTFLKVETANKKQVAKIFFENWLYEVLSAANQSVSSYWLRHISKKNLFN